MHMFYLQYCTPIWRNNYPTHLLSLLRLQKNIIRIITNSNYSEHSQLLFKDTNILKIFDINKLQIVIYMCKLLHSGNNTAAPPQRDPPTRTRNDLRVPAHNLSTFQLSLSYTGPKVWNSVPSNIKKNVILYSPLKTL